MSESCGDELRLLSDEEWLQCSNPEILKPGPYWGWGRSGYCPFTVEIDATPLAILIESAIRGCRVYELMSLRRPGDVLHYFRIRLCDVHQDIQNRVEKHLQKHRPYDKVDPKVMALPAFDKLFFWDGDDTEPAAECWLRFREQPFWRERQLHFHALVMKFQQQLRKREDYLVQHELASIAQGTHWRNFESALPRHPEEVDIPPTRTELPLALFNLIQDLIGRENVQSVSCPLNDYVLWRLLVEQQVRRAGLSGKPPQEVFELSGPDSGLSFVMAKDWGGEVHIPYEGACTGSLFIKPGWRKFSFETMRHTCQFLLTQDDYGDQACASRTVVVDDWILYEYKGVYSPHRLFP